MDSEQQKAIARMKAQGLPIRNDNIDAILGRAPQRPSTERSVMFEDDDETDWKRYIIISALDLNELGEKVRVKCGQGWDTVGDAALVYEDRQYRYKQSMVRV